MEGGIERCIGFRPGSVPPGAVIAGKGNDYTVGAKHSGENGVLFRRKGRGKEKQEKKNSEPFP
jgi:hypothetical protein